LKDYSIFEAGLFASAGASLKIEHIGPLSTSIKNIKKRIKKNYKQGSLKLIA